MRITRKAGLLLSVALFTIFLFEAASPHLLCTGAFAASADTEALLSGGAPGILRLHVGANSDSDEDQRGKYLVRDALIQRFAPAQSKDEADQVLLNDGSGVLETVYQVLQEQGCSYGAQLRLGVMEFPERTYGDTVFPAGEYEALRVELGTAEGKNWWCVLFPPLCLVDAGVQDIPDSDKLVFESDIARLIKEWQDSNTAMNNAE